MSSSSFSIPNYGPKTSFSPSPGYIQRNSSRYNVPSRSYPQSSYPRTGYGGTSYPYGTSGYGYQSRTSNVNSSQVSPACQCTCTPLYPPQPINPYPCYNPYQYYNWNRCAAPNICCPGGKCPQITNISQANPNVNACAGQYQRQCATQMQPRESKREKKKRKGSRKVGQGSGQGQSSHVYYRPNPTETYSKNMSTQNSSTEATSSNETTATTEESKEISNGTSESANKSDGNKTPSTRNSVKTLSETPVLTSTTTPTTSLEYSAKPSVGSYSQPEDSVSEYSSTTYSTGSPSRCSGSGDGKPRKKSSNVAESRSHEGLDFCFNPDSAMATELTVTIEPDEPDPLEYAIDHGIMPIICGYMPPSAAPVVPHFPQAVVNNPGVGGSSMRSRSSLSYSFPANSSYSTSYTPSSPSWVSASSYSSSGSGSTLSNFSSLSTNYVYTKTYSYPEKSGGTEGSAADLNSKASKISGDEVGNSLSNRSGEVGRRGSVSASSRLAK